MSKYNNIEFIEKNANGIEIVYANIETISYLPDNIKSHDLPDIISSIEKYGFVDPIGINETTGHDLDGNGRLEALLEMKKQGKQCPKFVIESGGKWFAPTVKNLQFSLEDEEVLAIRLNRSNEKGGIDNIKALEVLRRIKEQSPEEFVHTGYDLESLKKIQLLAKFAKQQLEVVQEKEEKIEKEIRSADFSEIQAKWKVKKNNLFQLGNNFLLCGDSTKEENFLRLKQDNHITLCFTSPPYSEQRVYELDSFDWLETMKGVYQVLFENTEAPFHCITNLGLVHKDGEVLQYWEPWLQFCKYKLEQNLFGWYVWDKIHGSPGDHNGRLAFSHEWFFHHKKGNNLQANKWIETTGESLKRGVKGGAVRLKSGQVKIGMSSPNLAGQDYKIPDSVVRLHPELARGIHTELHPATFPLSLPEFFIMTYTDMEDYVYEPFGGSGTTLLACQKLYRKCLIQEISENYCALILERFSRNFPDIEIKLVE